MTRSYVQLQPSTGEASASVDPSRAPREALLSTAFTWEPPAASAPSNGQESGASGGRGVLSRRHGPPRRLHAEEYPVPPAATQGDSG